VKIGIVSPYAYPRPGGANDNIRETYENLRRRGHEVRIITAPWGDDPPAQDVIQIGQAIAVPYNGSVGRVTLSARLEYLVTRILDRERFDIIHHHEPLVPLLSAQILDRKSCPQVATFHAFGGFSFSYWLGRPIGRRYMNKLDGRIAVSSAARHFISRYFPGEYEIIPNGVEVDFFAMARRTSSSSAGSSRARAPSTWCARMRSSSSATPTRGSSSAAADPSSATFDVSSATNTSATSCSPVG